MRWQVPVACVPSGPPPLLSLSSFPPLSVFPSLSPFIQRGSRPVVPAMRSKQHKACSLTFWSHTLDGEGGNEQTARQPMRTCPYRTEVGRESSSVQFSSVSQSCPTLFDPMDHSIPGFPALHRLPEFTQTHVHRVGDAIQPSALLSSPFPPTFNLSQHQGLFP